MPTQASNRESALVAIHDSARPLVRQEDVERCLQDGMLVRAAQGGLQ